MQQRVNLMQKQSQHFMPQNHVQENSSIRFWIN